MGTPRALVRPSRNCRLITLFLRPCGPMSTPAHKSEITAMIAECARGGEGAVDRLFARVYDDLRAIAHRQLRDERPGHTLSTTALVHEAYLALVDQTQSGWRDRAHFFAVASSAMRHVLIDHARRRSADKRGGGRIRVPLREGMAPMETPSVDLLDLDRALTELGDRHARMARIVECRFFGGMTAKETAEAIGVSRRTVERDWTRAKAHLHLALAPSSADLDRPSHR